MSLFSTALLTVAVQLITQALCQFHMPYPMHQMAQMQQNGPPSQMAPMMHNMASMNQISPMRPQPVFQPPNPFQTNMQMPFPGQRNMPSVVMPYYSRSANRQETKYRRKRRKPRKYGNDFSDSSSDEHDFRRSRSKKRRQVLTPIVSYVTKDGYVVYQKKIKKDKAKEWLETTKKKESKEKFSSAEERQFQKMLKYKKKHRH